LTTCSPADPSATKAIPSPMAISFIEAFAGSVYRVMNWPVWVGSDALTTSMTSLLLAVPGTGTSPARIPSPEPFSAIAPSARVLAENPETSFGTAGVETSTVM
jgi:hypothetical protein